MPFVRLPFVVDCLHRCIVIIGACLLLAGSACAQAPLLTPNLAYTSDSTGSYLADLYQPASPGIHPALVLIHGGSWRSGNRHELRHLATDLAAHGYVCLSIDYDLHPHSFPFSWQESREAVVFLRTHAGAYGIDPDRIGVLGT